MKKAIKTSLTLILGISLLGLSACEDEKEKLTTAEKLEGVWFADANTGSLGNATPQSGSLAGAGWSDYTLTLNEDGTYSVTGSSAYDVAPYGDGDGIINYSGTYTIDDTEDPMWIDLTCTQSDNIFFTTADTLQPQQPGIFELNENASEITIQYGAMAYGIPRPTAFIADPGPGTLVKQ